MAIRFYANTTSAQGSTTVNNYSRASLGTFAVTTNTLTISSWVKVLGWGPTGTNPIIVAKQNTALSGLAAENFQWYLGLNRESTAASPKTVTARFN
jgi:hypothetical protein